MRGSSLLLLALLAALPPSSAQAVPANVAAAVKAKDRPAEAAKLDADRKPVQVLRFFGLQRGQRALDLFTGSGYYAEIMARAVGPKGSVLAWQPANFQDEEGAKVWSALQARVPNVRLLVSTAEHMELAPNSVDFVMLHLNYHDTYWENETAKMPRMDPAAFLAKVFAAVKPGGTVGVVDHIANPGGDVREVVAKLHRIDPAVVRADFEKAGFRFDGESKLLRNPDDDHSKQIFDPAIRGKSDRLVYRFKKPA